MDFITPYFTLYVLYFLTGSLLTAIVTYLFINRQILQPGWSLYLVFTAWLWFVAVMLEYILLNNNLKVLFHYIQYGCLVLFPYFWLIFSLRYQEQKGTPPIYQLLCVIPSIIFLFLLVQNSQNNIFWLRIALNKNQINLIKEYSAQYWVVMAYVDIYVLAGIIILIIKSLRQKQFQKKRTSVLVIAAVISLIVSAAEKIWERELEYFHLTPIALAASSLFVLYFFRLRYYRTIPLAQHSVVESMCDVLVILNPDDQIIYLNPAAIKILNVPPSHAIGKSVAEVFPDLSMLLNMAADSRQQDVEIMGTFYNANFSYTINRLKTVSSKIIILRDITRLKQTETNLTQIRDNLEVLVEYRTKELDDTNKTLKMEIDERKAIEQKQKELLEDLNSLVNQKNILIKEIHHRVKNNLQIITSLLRLQKKNIVQPELKQIFELASSRILAIAMIHEKLYKNDDLSNTSIKDYIKDLTRYLVHSFAADINKIKLNVDILDEINLDLDKSILCGLIINELVVNAIKHAFPEEYSGDENIITIRFAKKNNNYLLIVNDNGVGLPPGVDINFSESLGMKIVRTLVKQLKGAVKVKNNQGTEVSVSFPV